MTPEGSTWAPCKSKPSQEVPPQQQHLHERQRRASEPLREMLPHHVHSHQSIAPVPGEGLEQEGNSWNEGSKRGERERERETERETERERRRDRETERDREKSTCSQEWVAEDWLSPVTFMHGKKNRQAVREFWFWCHRPQTQTQNRSGKIYTLEGQGSQTKKKLRKDDTTTFGRDFLVSSHHAKTNKQILTTGVCTWHTKNNTDMKFALINFLWTSYTKLRKLVGPEAGKWNQASKPFLYVSNLHSRHHYSLHPKLCRTTHTIVIN